jgi:lipoprotein-anchoring transpeptidase ErfK/SrfK
MHLKSVELPKLHTRVRFPSPAPISGTVLQDGALTVPEIDLANPSLVRQEVAWRGHQRPGSIVVVVPERCLYLVQGNERYAVGVGRAEALNFRGSAVIGRKESWPRWTPTAHMMAAIPSYRPCARGMDGGPQ